MMRRLISILAALAFAGAAQAQTLSAYVSSVAPTGTARTFSARTVNFGATGDQATIAIPSTIAKYQITAVNITNCSATPLLAQPALYTAASAGGTNLVAATIITGATSASVILSSTLAGTVGSSSLTAPTLFVNVSVANVGALTCDIYVTIKDLT